MFRTQSESAIGLRRAQVPVDDGACFAGEGLLAQLEAPGETLGVRVDEPVAVQVVPPVEVKLVRARDAVFKHAPVEKRISPAPRAPRRSRGAPAAATRIARVSWSSRLARGGCAEHPRRVAPERGEQLAGDGPRSGSGTWPPRACRPRETTLRRGRASAAPCDSSKRQRSRRPNAAGEGRAVPTVPSRR